MAANPTVNPVPTIPDLVRGYYKKIEEEFDCPVDYEAPFDPIIDQEGHSMDRSTYRRLQPKICPLSRHPLNDENIYANSALKSLISEFFKRKRDEGANFYENYRLALVPFKAFFCSLNDKILMLDPVTDEHGCSFDRRNIERHLEENNNVCPVYHVRRAQITHLIANLALKNCIDHWFELKQAVQNIERQQQAIVVRQRESSFAIEVRTISVINDFIDFEEPPSNLHSQVLSRFLTSTNLLGRFPVWDSTFKYRDVEELIEFGDNLQNRIEKWNLDTRAVQILEEDICKALVQKQASIQMQRTDRLERQNREQEQEMRSLRRDVASRDAIVENQGQILQSQVLEIRELKQINTTLNQTIETQNQKIEGLELELGRTRAEYQKVCLENQQLKIEVLSLQKDSEEYKSKFKELEEKNRHINEMATKMACLEKEKEETAKVISQVKEEVSIEFEQKFADSQRQTTEELNQVKEAAAKREKELQHLLAASQRQAEALRLDPPKNSVNAGGKSFVHYKQPNTGGSTFNTPTLNSQNEVSDKEKASSTRSNCKKTSKITTTSTTAGLAAVGIAALASAPLLPVAVPVGAGVFVAATLAQAVYYSTKKK